MPAKGLGDNDNYSDDNYLDDEQKMPANNLPKGGGNNFSENEGNMPCGGVGAMPIIMEDDEEEHDNALAFLADNDKNVAVDYDKDNDECFHSEVDGDYHYGGDGDGDDDDVEDKDSGDDVEKEEKDEDKNKGNGNAAIPTAVAVLDPSSLFLHANKDSAAMLCFFADDSNNEEVP
jgi:hypothetical protein